MEEFFAHKIDEVCIEVNLSEKPEIMKINKDLSNNGDSTLQDCFELFKEPEQLDEENAWYCFQCEDMRLAYKQLEIKIYPKHLMIHLNRFRSDGQGKMKNSEPVNYSEVEVFGNHKLCKQETRVITQYAADYVPTWLAHVYSHIHVHVPVVVLL